ncbi:hypothetical protein HRbin12_00993 [bacterium HR12]|nr:hypothetical protein HRbin12_00993 [bacterium HR12]
MPKVIYEGPDEALIVGGVELSRGVPVEMRSTEARAAAAFAGVRIDDEGSRRRPQAEEGQEE